MPHYDAFLSDEDDICPLCAELMDESDKAFLPCTCEYQICQFCYHNIRQNPDLNDRCPACRRKYKDENVKYIVSPSDQIKAASARKAVKEKRHKDRKELDTDSKRSLADMRVVQKNLVYVIGLNPQVDHENLQSLLRSDQYFGQYGKISKLVVNKRNQNANSVGNSGYGVYVTYSRKLDADKCIKEIDGTVIDGKVIKAAHGTTKYCSSYLRGQPCPNPYCMYLHEPGEYADSYKKHESSKSGHLAKGHSSQISATAAENITMLPATASWANPGSKITSTTNVLHTNSEEFPTLAETVLQKNQHKGKRDSSGKHKMAHVDFGLYQEYNTVKESVLKGLEEGIHDVNFESQVSAFERKYKCKIDDCAQLFGFVDAFENHKVDNYLKEGCLVSNRVLANSKSYGPFNGVNLAESMRTDS